MKRGKEELKLMLKLCISTHSGQELFWVLYGFAGSVSSELKTEDCRGYIRAFE